MRNTTTTATLRTTTTAAGAGRWQDVLEALASATTVDDAEAAIDATHEAAYSAGYSSAHDVPALAKALAEMQDALDEIREEERAALVQDLEDEESDALDLPTGWDVRVESGHFTGAAVARIFDNTGEERRTLAYWDGWDDLAATAWELYELDNTRSGVHFRALAAEMERANR